MSSGQSIDQDDLWNGSPNKMTPVLKIDPKSNKHSNAKQFND